MSHSDMQFHQNVTDFLAEKRVITSATSHLHPRRSENPTWSHRCEFALFYTVTTAACSDPLIGEWRLDDYNECKEYCPRCGTIYLCMDLH